MAIKKAKKKYKPWPKVKGWKGHGVPPLDYDQIKKIYLEGPDYDWGPFCERHGYGRTTDRDRWKDQGADFNEWKKEWLRTQAGIQDAELAPKVLDLRRVISQKRVDLVQDWVNRTQYFKALLDGVLKAHGAALQHDERNAGLIQRGDIKPKFLMSADDLSTLSSAAQRIQDIELKSLLVLSSNAPGSGPLMAPTDREKEEGNVPAEFKITTMGQSGMTGAESARFLAHWFDQAPREAQHVEAVEEEGEEEYETDPS